MSILTTIKGLTATVLERFSYAVGEVMAEPNNEHDAGPVIGRIWWNGGKNRWDDGTDPRGIYDPLDPNPHE